MINTIIVDDEYLVRERIKKCVDWGKMGYQVVGEASNGEEALELMEKYSPQLAVVDINMPFTNGLDFSKIVAEKYPDTKIIILTGYSRFEYARSALQAGVYNYLLKPINRDELACALEQIKDRIEREIQIRANIEKLKMNSRESTVVQREQFISSLLNENTLSLSREDLMKFRQYFTRLRHDGFFVMVLDIDRLSMICDCESEKKLWRFAVRNIFDEVFGKESFHEISCDADGRIVILASVETDNADKEKEIYIRLCEEARYFVKEYLHFAVSVGVGNVYFSDEGVLNSYKEALAAFRSKIILGGDRVTEYCLLESGGNITVDMSGMRQKILINLRLGNIIAVRDEIVKVFDIIKNRRPSVENLYLAVSELIVTATSYAGENELDAADFTCRKLNPASLVDEKEDIEEIKKWYLDIFYNLIDKANNSRQTNTSKTVEKAKEYIDKNYCRENVDLEEIASNIFVNPSYLSNIFKRETGRNITEYIREQRMENAKKLIDEGYKSLYNIAEKVGYSDPHYFSKCFKKYFGIPPSKYMETRE